MNQPLVPSRAPFDRNTLATTMQSSGAGRGITFAPSDFAGLLEVANMMAASGPAVPKHLRGNPGMCLSVSMTAYQNEFNPFLLAGDTFVVNDVLAYGAKSIAAMVNNSPKLEKRLRLRWEGEWPNRRCFVTGRIKGEDEDHPLEIKAETIKVRNSPLWVSQPDIQLGYYSQRAWGRLYMSEILLGLLDREEAAEVQHHSDITSIPRPTRGDHTSAASGPVIDVDHEEQPFSEEKTDDAPVPFALVNEDGEEREFDDAATWANAFYAAFKNASSLDQARGLWETNSNQLQRLRDEHEKGATLADAIEKAYGAAFEKFNPRKPVEAEEKPMPETEVSTDAQKDERPNAPRDLGKIPTREAGGFDWFTAAKKLGDAISASASLEDVTAWQQLNMRWIEGIQKGASPQYATLQKTIQATVEILQGAES